MVEVRISVDYPITVTLVKDQRRQPMRNSLAMKLGVYRTDDEVS